MSLIRDRVNKIKEAKRVQDSGGYNCIPWHPYYPRLAEYLPGIIKGVQYLVTAASGIGKTQLTKHLFVRCPYDFIKNNPDTKLKLKVLYFALEETKDEFIDSLIVAKLAQDYKIYIDSNDLRGLKKNSLPDDVIEKVEECVEYFEEMEDCLDIIDSVRNPYGAYLYCREYSRANGVHYYTNLVNPGKTYIPHEGFLGMSKLEREKFKYSHYEPNNPNEYVVVISDHIWLYGSEGGMTKYDTIAHFSSNYCRTQMSKHWGYCIVNVQQQSGDSERKQFDYRGNSIISKLEPSLDGLGDIKVTQRDALVVLGLFAPNRYGIETYPEYNGYNVGLLGDNFRMLFILKNRIGKPGLRLPLYFNGATNTFKELPQLGSEELNKFYRWYRTQKD